MIEQTDASKSDERRVKNTSNPLTRKRKGETHKMGERCMFKMFFVIGLMLIAGLFSNTAMAADGGGTAKVAWGNAANADAARTLGTIDSGGDNEDNSEGANTAPLAAGSLWNIVRITFTATDADNLGGGVVRIQLPDWTMGKIAANDTTTANIDEKDHYQYVTITSAPTGGTSVTLYSTNAGSQNVDANGGEAGNGTEAEIKALLDMVSLSQTRVQVKLSGEWSEGGTLTITLGDLTADVPSRLPNAAAAADQSPYANYQFTTSSMTKNGTLIRIGTQPNVRVGNILGLRTADADADNATRDTLKRVFDVSPSPVYQGENRTISVKFTVPGPMYPTNVAGDDNNTNVIVAIPADLRPLTAAASDASVINVSSNGPGIGTHTVTTGAGDGGTPERFPVESVTIPLTGVNKDQTITVRYTADIGSTQTAAGVNVFTGLETTVASTTTVAATKVDGGAVRTVAASGMVELLPVAVEAGSQRANIKLTYTADTDLTDATIAITPNGIVLDADHALQKGSSGYGYVTGAMSDSLTVSDNVITWTGIDLKKEKSVTATIHRVDIVEDPREYTWSVSVGDTPFGATAATSTNPKFSVVKTSRNAVQFEIVGDSTFAAGSEQTITFRFTAVDTAIRGGNVSLRIPEMLGSKPTLPKGEGVGQATATITSGGALEDDQPAVSDRTITANIKSLDIGGSVTITYGSTADDGKEAVLSDVSGDVEVTGSFQTSASGSRRSTETKTITLGNIADGTGTAEVNRNTREVQAGSNKAVIIVEYTAAGTMNGGKVSLEIPEGWGAMQDDSVELNYIEAEDSAGREIPVDIMGNGTIAIAKLNKFAKGDKFTFTYGGGTAGDKNGAEVQDAVETVDFTIKSDGDGDDVFALITSELKHEEREKALNPDKTGKIYADAPGKLKVKVTSAGDGTGIVTVEDKDGNPPAVRAADDNVTLVFTYTPIQTIVDGALAFTVPSSWSKPQVEEVGEPGFTEVSQDGGANIGAATDNGQFTVDIPIFFMDKDQTITITYGAGDGPAKASTALSDDAFKIEVKGSEDGNLSSRHIVQPTVEVKRQASGNGKAVAAVTDDGSSLHAGDMGREITVTYTAAGEMVAGAVRLTIPANWSEPTADNVMVAGMTPTFDGQMVMVDGVNLMALGTVVFVYTGDVQPKAGTGVKFAVAVDGDGSGTEDSYVDVSGDETMLTVDVREARPGSGSGDVTPKVVTTGATEETLTFTYTADGEIAGARREFRVRVPASWTTVDLTSQDYTVRHETADGTDVGSRSIEKLDPIGQDMVARVKLGGIEVAAEDKIIFAYETDAPDASGLSQFAMTFDRQPVDNLLVRVQDSMPSMLSLRSTGTVAADEGAMLGITVELQDADGNAVAMNNDAMVTLMSSSTAGVFTRDGEAGTIVTIDGGTESTMVYYSDSTAGTATITATATGLTAAMPHEVTVTAAAVAPDAVVIDSVTVAPTLAMAGEAVTVSAMGSAGQMAMFSVDAIVTDKAMMEDEAGSYSGSFMVVADQHADGMYSVTVNLGTASDMASLTLDSTMPTVTVTAPESAENGDMVMISATVTDASAISSSSVMVDVSMLDSTQTDPVALAMGDDGAYSASVTISDENSHANGSKTVTVTAMDAAGNSGMGTATVELANTLSYTSMIPAGISLFHVPLDVDGLDTVGDLKGMIGNGSNLAIVYDHATGSWNGRSDDVAITADLGIVLSMGSAATYTFEGAAWDGGASMISLQAGTNLIGLPVNDPRVTNVSDIAGLFAEGVVSTITISTDDGFEVASDTIDPAVTGDAAYLVIANTVAPVTATLLGDGWTYSDMAGAAPIALAGYSVEGQTAVLDVNGSIVDEITGLAREGFRVKVKNLSTKASLSRVTSVETAEGYNMTFVDLKAGNAARIGDVLEISADSPSPLIGVTPVRHIVTADDVKSGILELEDLIAYEIPAETELLRNYPNPFNPETWIPYRLAEDADVSLTIYDVNGELVRSIDMGHQSAAVYESRSKAIYWDGRNRFGEQVASGIYFYNLSTGDFSATRKMVILK